MGKRYLLELGAIGVGAAAATFLALAWAQPRSYTGKAIAIDGDTLRIARQSFRLWGIDAEELHENHGMAAKGDLVHIISGREVRCDDTGSRSYKRIVAKCFLVDTGTDIAADLVWRGTVLDCARYSHGHYRPMEPAWARDVLSQKSYCEEKTR